MLLICSCAENSKDLPTNNNTNSSEVIIEEIDTLQEDTNLTSLPIDLSIFGKLAYKSKIYKNLGHEVTELESLGCIQIGQEQNEVIMILGKPDSTSTHEYWGVDGGEHTYWYYNQLGLKIELMNIEGQKPSYVQTIQLKNKDAIITAKGITIGSDFNAVIKQYSPELMFEGSSITEGMISFGEGTYSELKFELTNNKVTHIYLGPTIRC